MKKILIISTNAVGDTYLSLSAVRVLKNKFPESIISIVSCYNSFKVFNGEQIFANSYIIHKNSTFSFLKVILTLTRQKFDLAFSFFPGRKNSIILFLSRSIQKGGFINFLKINRWDNTQQKVYVKSIQDEILYWKPFQTYLDRIRMCLKRVNIDATNLVKWHCELSAVNLCLKNYIVIHPFSRIFERSLPAQKLVYLIEYLRKSEFQIIIIGTNYEISRMKQQFVNLNIEYQCDLRIDRLTDLIRSCRIFIAVDSFPLHVADSVNANFIGLFGPTNPQSVLVNLENILKYNVDSLADIESEKLVKEIDVLIKKRKLFS